MFRERNACSPLLKPEAPMPTKRVRVNPATNEIYNGEELVGTTDRVYDVSPGTIVIKEITVKGDLSGTLTYNGHQLRARRVGAMIGLKVDGLGARGPVWEDVEFEVVS
jgi:hypothetical protein